jgi:hypothetical protein
LDIDAKDDWDAMQEVHGQTFEVVLAFNVVHIVPWSTVETLFRAVKPGNGVLSGETGRLVLYGAFNERGRFTSEGNEKVSGK